jgi:hypothetical protein
VNLAVLAHRALFQRTVQAPLNGIDEKLATLRATGVALQGSQLQREIGERFARRLVMVLTINRREPGEDFKILYLFAG